MVVPESSVARLVGARLDWSDDGDGGLVIVNPNTPPRPEVLADRPEVDLSSDLAQRVLTVLDAQVNPSIAMHGGHADLVAVEDGRRVRAPERGLPGMRPGLGDAVTGHRGGVRDSVPEVVSVVDVTDHASGANPFYEPAKK